MTAGEAYLFWANFCHAHHKHGLVAFLNAPEDTPCFSPNSIQKHPEESLITVPPTTPFESPASDYLYIVTGPRTVIFNNL
jgi:hypothetical protein